MMRDILLQPDLSSRSHVQEGGGSHFNLDDIDLLLEAVADIDATKDDSAGVELAPMTNLQHRDWLRRMYLQQKRDFFRMDPGVIQTHLMPVALSEFAGQLREIRDTNLESLEVDITFDDTEHDSIEDEVIGVLSDISERVVQPLQAEIIELQSGSLSPEEVYTKAVSLNQRLFTVSSALSATQARLDRNFFDYCSDPGLRELFFAIKGAVSEASHAVHQMRSEHSAAVLPVEEIRGLQASFTGEATDDVALFTEQVGSRLRKRTAELYPNNPNQSFLFHTQLSDVLAELKSDENVTPEMEQAIFYVGMSDRLWKWIDEKRYSQLNADYVSGGVGTIAVADDCLRQGGEEVFEHLRLMLKDEKLLQPVAHEVPPIAAVDVFVSNVQDIAESRSKVARIVEAVRNRTELMTPNEAMKEVSELTRYMNSGDAGKVMEKVEALEERTIDLYHETPDRSSYHGILESGKLFSKWSSGQYGDTFFGGGAYFWGAQQEDWMKAGYESIHLPAVPLRDMFIIRNKYNDPRKARRNGSQSGFGRGATDDDYTHEPQKKFNILAMLPVGAVVIKAHEEHSGGPRNNEGYTADTIAEVTEFGVEEVPFIWRIDKHYGNYDTGHSINGDTEAQLKEYLGEAVRIERGVTAPGFISGEYDRMIVSRDISILKATSLAYALRIPEVVYEDQLEQLHTEAEEREDRIQKHYDELAPQLMEGKTDGQRKSIEQLLRGKQLSPAEQSMARFFIAQYDGEVIDLIVKEQREILDPIRETLPTRGHIKALIPKKEWFIHESSIHGSAHLMRVLFNVELLSRLSQKEFGDTVDINRRALEIAAVMHDVRRLSDRASDVDHGKRAAEFLEERSDIFADESEECRLCARGVMHNHAYDDHNEMTPEEIIFKDADALDRYRFNRGPDWKYMRTEASRNISTTSFIMAQMSQFFQENGHGRAESVMTAATVLGLMQEETTDESYLSKSAATAFEYDPVDTYKKYSDYDDDAEKKYQGSKY